MPKRNVETTWDNIPITWESLLHTVWELFTFFVQTFGNVKTREYENIYKKLDDEKKKKVVKLICMVKGQKIEEEKEVQDFEVTVDDIDLVLERAKRIRPTLFLENVGE